MAEIKCISLWQPHASLVAFGEKPFETRHWSTRYRGLLAIHAAKREDNFVTSDLDNDGFLQSFFEVSEKHGWGEWYWPRPFIAAHNEPSVYRGLGAVLCVCECVDCLTTEEAMAFTEEQAKGLPPYWFLFGDFGPKRYAWALKNIRRFREPIPATGHQGLWNWKAPDDWESLLLPDVIHV